MKRPALDFSEKQSNNLRTVNLSPRTSDYSFPHENATSGWFQWASARTSRKALSYQFRRNMMKSRASIVVGCIAWMMMASGAFASSPAQFRLEICVWDASDIVVVSQGKKAGGGAEVTVLETWFGKLAKGERIRVLDLPETPIDVSKMGRGIIGDERLPKAVGGERIVLFLKPQRWKEETTPASQPGVKVFEGSNSYENHRVGEPRSAARVSAVWIEQGHAYAFQSSFNERVELVPLLNAGEAVEKDGRGRTEADLKKDVLAMLAAKEALAKAKALERPTDRIAAYRTLAAGPYYLVSREAVEMLGGCGKAALPTLKELMYDVTCYNGDVVSAIGKAAGDEAGQEITAILKEEMKYWQATGPQFGGDANITTSCRTLNIRGAVLSQSLRELKDRPYGPSREIVAQFRKFWLSRGEANSASRECDEVLAALDREAGRKPTTANPSRR
jgi:hypothetical protein